MKTIALTGALAGLMVALCSAQYDPRFPKPDAEADQTSTTVVHKDGTYTTTERDTERRRLVRQTMRSNGTIVMRSVFRLDENDRERKGQVYDGQGNVLFISEFIYDGAGAVLEERVYSPRGQPVRRLVYQADRLGRRKAFCHTYSDGRPMGELMPLDDPTPFSTTSAHAHSTGTDPGEVTSRDGTTRVNVGGALGYTDRAPTTTAPKPEAKPEPRRRLRLFRRR